MNEDRTGLLGHPFVAFAARWGVVAWAGIGVLVLGYIIFQYVLYPIRIIFPPLALALILVYALNPVVSALARRMPRLLAALVTYVVFLSAVGVGLAYLIPILAEQVSGFAADVPRLARGALAFVEQVAARVGFQFQAEGALSPESQQAVLNYLGKLLSFTQGLLHFALVVILGPILAFYLVVDLPKIRRGVVAMIPERRRAGFQLLGQRLGRVLGGFFRGQLLVALFVGVASTLALFVVGLPYWAVVGMVTGLFNLIPLIGPWIGGILAALVAFTTTETGNGILALEPGLPMAVGAGIALAIVQQIDNHVISPNIVARTVRLHPVTVMLALLAGGTLMGLWGMLLAVPTVAAVKVLLLHAWDTRMQWPPPGPVEREALAPEPPPPTARAAVGVGDGSPLDEPPGSRGTGAAGGIAPRLAASVRRWRSRRGRDVAEAAGGPSGTQRGRGAGEAPADRPGRPPGTGAAPRR